MHELLHSLVRKVTVMSAAHFCSRVTYAAPQLRNPGGLHCPLFTLMVHHIQCMAMLRAMCAYITTETYHRTYDCTRMKYTPNTGVHSTLPGYAVLPVRVLAKPKPVRIATRDVFLSWPECDWCWSVRMT